MRPFRHALMALAVTPAITMATPGGPLLGGDTAAAASIAQASSPVTGLRGSPRTAAEVPALRRTPRMGVAAPSGLRVTPRMDALAALRRTPRMDAFAGLRRTPRMDALLAVASGPALQAKGAGAKSKAKPRVPAATRILGKKRSTTRWFSGAWTGGYMSGARAEAFGRWRGTPMDAVTTYPDKSTWNSIRDSSWHITTYRSFPGRLVYGLPLLPERGPGTLADVAKGRYDSVFRKVASDLKKNGRGNAIVRIGFEANGDWFRYGGTAQNAATWRSAYRRVAKVMTATAPKLVTEFDITCGYSMPGSKHRLDSLTKLYPGDDVVDLIGCDMYDEWQTKARTPAQWRSAIKPRLSPGLTDVAAFARAHRKGMAIPEWGVAHPGRNGNGDNPFFINAMRTWMRQNADVLALENYFNDRDSHIRSDLWGGQNPKAAAAYRKAW